MTKPQSRKDFLKSTAALVGVVPAFSGAGRLLAAGIAELSGILVLTRASKSYDTARLDFNARIDDYPAIIAYCRSAQDVQRVITYANTQNLPLSVRAGSHDFEGYSLNTGGVVLDTSMLSGVQTTASGQLQVLPGTPLDRFYAWSVSNKITLPGGTCPSVGAAGLCSGGGFGPLSPWHGLFCDRLRRVQIVDARGNLLDSDSDPDLLWATRGGGGGNFGVLTALFFDPVPVPSNAVTFTVEWPWDAGSLRNALQMYFAWVTGSGAAYYLSFAATARSTGSFSLKGLGLGDVNAIRADILAHLGSAGGALSLQAATFADVVEFFGGEGQHKRVKAKTHLGHDVPATAAIDAIVQHLSDTPGPGDQIELDSFGDAINAFASDATAFPHRNMKYILLYVAQWDGASDDSAHQTWIRSLYDAVDAYFPAAAYRNFSDADLPDWQRRYYGRNYTRLRQIKARLDPQNRFHYAQSIEL